MLLQDDNPNPYFRVALDIPDGVKTQQQTKTFRGTTSPEIGEDFYFQVGILLKFLFKTNLVLFR